MKLYKYLFFIVLIHLFLISLNANEKLLIENDNTEEILNNEIDSQFCFSLKIDKFINSKKNSSITKEDYLRKARDFLFIGITGIFFTGLAIPATVGGATLLWFLTYRFELVILIPFFGILILFIAIGIPLFISGFYYYCFYREQKIPDPFTNENKNNEIVLFKFNFKKLGG